MKITVDLEDGNGPKEWVVAPAVPTEVVDVVPGEVIEVVAEAAPVAPTA